MRLRRGVCVWLLVASSAWAALPGRATAQQLVPAAARAPPTDAPTSASPFAGVLSTLRPDPSNDYGLIVENFATGERAMVNEDRVFPSGSVYKLPLAWHIMRLADRGRLRFDDPIEILPDDTLEPEPYGGFGAGDTLTVGDAVQAMFSISSNAAAHALLRTVGRRDLNQALGEAGLTRTHVPETAEDGEAVTTANDLVHLMRLIAAARGLRPDLQSEMLVLLELGRPPDALREILDDDVRVLDKTGNLTDSSNVAALLSTARGTVILVVLDEGVDPGEARAIIGQLGRAAASRLLEEALAELPVRRRVQRRRWQRDLQGMDHVHGAARAAQPDSFELGAVVDTANRAVGPRGRIVDDRVARAVEADDHDQMAVRAAIEQKAVQLARARLNRRYQRDARAHDLLGFVQRAQLGDERLEPEPRRVRGIEWPVARATVRGVVRRARRLDHIWIGERRIHPGDVGRRRGALPVFDHHLG